MNQIRGAAMTYKEFFTHAFGKQEDGDFGPFDYQRQLAEAPWPDLLDVPTGMGKTAAVTLAWLWNRGWRIGKRGAAADAHTPRRLVYCLPMRVLVEQTHQSMCDWLQRLDLIGQPGDGRVSVHVLMGGADDTKTWVEYPDEDMILVGTQDMLLSRALMRGYGMSPYAWPVHFALLHNDAMWVFDEVQLMGASLATSAQLEAFRRSLPVARRSRSLWISATLNRAWLATVDMKPHVDALTHQTIGDQDRAQAGGRLEALKAVKRAPCKLSEKSDSKKGLDVYLEELCDFVLRNHDPTAQTLVIVNRVDRAQGLYRLLRARRSGRNDLLIHARFRGAERARQSQLLREEANLDRIVIATQAIEAGVDISSKVLITELAPWPSLVQRFGRCNRYGEHNAAGGASIFWIDVVGDSDVVLPYRDEELTSARAKLAALISASPGKLPPTDEARSLSAVLRRKDLLDLFNTDPDLSGFDVDISDYIRDSGVPGLQVFWREFDDPNQPQVQGAPDRTELCPVSIGQTQGLRKRDAWSWDSLDGAWTRLDRDPRPGMTLLLCAADGGYDTQVGFDTTLKQPVPLVARRSESVTEPAYGEDSRSQQRLPVMLADHLGHVADFARQLCESVGEAAHAGSVIRAGRWHDVGKLHAVFHDSMHCCDKAPPGFLAKSPCRGRHSRRFFRHELASMLAWLDQHGHEPDADLIAYLIVAHHGKVRMSLRAMPTEQARDQVKRFARGVWEGDVLPALAFDGEHSGEITLRLAMMEMGVGEQGPSWTARTLTLLNAHGPFRLAWLETLVRLADWRASAAEQRQVGTRQ
jgi:CRISPR-associated endonuclease/helicase Cas3